MRPSEILPQHRETIRQLVLKAGMSNPRVFGSVIRGEDTEASDLDILVDPAPRASLLAMELLQTKLEVETGIKVDCAHRRSFIQSFVAGCWMRPYRCEQERSWRQRLSPPHPGSGGQGSRIHSDVSHRNW
jgi:predicted nucleotidyltransferase